MTNITQFKQQVATATVTPIQDLIQKNVKALGECLPAHLTPERMVRIALTTLKLNPELYKCTPNSFMGALFTSAMLGLEPNIEGQAYILPFNNKRKQLDGSWKTVKEAQFQIGYKGYAELFYRHEAALSLDMQKVCDGDEFDYSFGTDNYIHHKPALTNRGPVIAYYAVAKLKGNVSVFKIMTVEECLAHAQKHSKCFDKRAGKFNEWSPWATEFDAMCLKTVLIQLMKLLPKSIEIQKAIAVDETIKTKVDRDMFEVKDETVWNGDAEEHKEVTVEPATTEVTEWEKEDQLAKS